MSFTGIAPTSGHAGYQCSNFLDDLEALGGLPEVTNCFIGNEEAMSKKDLASVATDLSALASMMPTQRPRRPSRQRCESSGAGGGSDLVLAQPA